MVFGYLRGFKASPKIVLESRNNELMPVLVSQSYGASLFAGIVLQANLKNKRPEPFIFWSVLGLNCSSDRLCKVLDVALIRVPYGLPRP
jgi:hypothetical protein